MSAKRVFFFIRRVRLIYELVDYKSVCNLLNFGVELQEFVNLLDPAV